jgi:SAM-dependent methyltransferase
MMTLNTLAPIYDPFARMYNEYWGPRYCKDNIEILEKILLPNLPAQAHILDLCCGTGQLVQALIQKGFGTTGIDASMGMLTYARQNAPSGQFIHGDARSFDLPLTVDAVVSTSASLNHIMTLEDLKSVFQNVYKVLKTNGLFALEINLEEALKSMNLDKEGDVLDDYAWASVAIYNLESRLGQIKMTLFAEHQGVWQRFDESWPLKGYSRLEIESTLEEVGFANVKICNTEYNSELSQLLGSTFFMAHK